MKKMRLNEDVFLDMPDVDYKLDTELELKGPEPGEDVGVSGLLLDLIGDVAKNINDYNQLQANLENYPEVAEMIKDFADEENMKLGKIQSALKTISPNAEYIMNGAVEADQEMDPGSPIDESLRRLNEADRPDGAPINFWEPGGEDAEEYYQTNILTDMFDADPSRFEQALEDFGYNPTKYDNFDSFLKDVDKVDLLNKFADLLQKNDELNSSWYDHFDFTEAPLPFDFDESLNESSKSNASLTFKNNSGALELYAYNYVDPDLSDEEAIEYKERPYWKNWYKTRSEAVEDYKIIDSICNKYNVRIWPHDNHTFNNKNEVEIVGPSKNIIKKALNELRRRYDFEMIDESLKEDFVPKYFYRVMKYLYNNDYEGCDEIELEELLMNSPQFHNMSEKTAEAYVEEYLTYYRDPKEFRKLKVDESLKEDDAVDDDNFLTEGFLHIVKE